MHKNCGSGYADQELANITLAWMVDQLSHLIAFSPDYVLQQYELCRQEMKGEEAKWSFGKRDVLLDFVAG